MSTARVQAESPVHGSGLELLPGSAMGAPAYRRIAQPSLSIEGTFNKDRKGARRGSNKRVGGED